MPSYLKKQESRNLALELSGMLKQKHTRDEIQLMFVNRTDDETFIEIGKLANPDKKWLNHIYCWAGAEIAMDSIRCLIL